MRYSANISAGSLKVPESRAVAGLLLKGVDSNTWNKAIVEQNVLQARNPQSAIRIGRLVRQRLELMKSDLWRLVKDGSGSVATHAIFAAAIKHSPLLGDFLDLVVREQFRVFNTTLSKKLFDDYLQDCRDAIRRCRSSTKSHGGSSKPRSSTSLCKPDTLAILAGSNYAKFISRRKSWPTLSGTHEEYVLRCIQVSP